jgi:sugar/nucleoside kinase (ribokinase family)
LTDNGKGIASFFFKELPSDLGVLTASLLENYLLRLVSLYRNQGMSESVIFDVFTKTRGLAILDGSIKYQNPEFMLFGASAFYTQIDCDSIPGVGGLESCDIPSRYPGGPSVELALALAEVGRQVTFVSEVGNDQDGYNIISHLVQNKVDVTNVKVENDLRTNETIIINDKTGSRQLIGYGDTSALSVPSLKEVPWSLLEESKVVYIGEVFVEIALSIANTANQNDIPLIYRPSILFLERGLDTIEPILKQTDFLILSQRALNFIKTGIKNSSMKRLRNLTKGSIIVRDSTDSYSVVNKNEETFTKSCGNQTQDITQWFVAGFLEGIVSGLDSYDSINKGIELEASKFIA